MKPTVQTIISEKGANNCYLIETIKGYLLIITGKKTNYTKLHEVLSTKGCVSSHINLIIFTSYSSSNYKRYIYLKEKYQADIAMHILDRELLNEPKSKGLAEKIKNIFRSKSAIKFEPDLIIDEGFNLSDYGLNARVLYVPGISKSVGILTENGELFCDDLEELNDHKKDAQNENSGYLERLKNLLVATVYPGHGDPLSLQSSNI
ncbi:MAG: hypothetical protein KQH79_16645 [Bacteroidetes bacterium]|nr:hypothetical protein [Bacteroidota bacterium]